MFSHRKKIVYNLRTNELGIGDCKRKGIVWVLEKVASINKNLVDFFLKKS